jgi:hypothetical protein
MTKGNMRDVFTYCSRIYYTGTELKDGSMQPPPEQFLSATEELFVQTNKSFVFPKKGSESIPH